MGLRGRTTTIYALAAGVCLLIAASATAAQESAIVKLKGGADVRGRIVDASKACRAKRKLRILRAENRHYVGSATTNSKGKFFAPLVFSGSVFAVATKTKQCKKAESSEAVTTGVADLSVSITGSSSIEFTVTNAGPDPASLVFVRAMVQATAPPPPGPLQFTLRIFPSIPVGGSEKFAFGGCAAPGTGTASADLLSKSDIGGGPSGQTSSFDPNKANNSATYQFACP